jgi:hypothetical protein
MQESRTSSFSQVSKEEETFYALKRQLDNLNESISYEETVVEEEVKAKEKDLKLFLKDNKSIHEHTGSIKNRI